MSKLELLIRHLAAHRAKTFLIASINVISKDYLEHGQPNPTGMISGVASFIATLIANNQDLRDHLISLILDDSILSLHNINTKRAVIAALSSDEDCMENLTEKSLNRFADTLYIQHAPILQQESLAKTVLISGGYVHRTQPTMFLLLARSSQQLQGVSNRLAATSSRARFLGMVVGMAVSELVDKPDKRIKFEFDETESTDAQEYLQLTRINDKIGKFEALVTQRSAVSSKSISILPSKSAKTTYKKAAKPAPARKAPPKGIQVIELSSDDDDDDLAPYAKPDTDSSDDDEDPTLVRRDKPRPPVYIRDLIEGLRESEDYDKHLVSLQNAADLIRRKTNFGREIHDHIEELATILVGYSNPLNVDNALEMRQQALIATLLADPGRMGKWLAMTFFEGDYSISQRLGILTALGLGARELAGFKNETTRTDVLEDAMKRSFPSKMLPDHLHKVYKDDQASVDSIAKKMEQLMLQPMSQKASEELAGPKALQVRTLSSRMEVEKRRKRPIANELAKVVADSLFFPLTGRFIAHTRGQ
jgi:telomere length regulation protein